MTVLRNDTFKVTLLTKMKSITLFNSTVLFNINVSKVKIPDKCHRFPKINYTCAKFKRH